MKNSGRPVERPDTYRFSLYLDGDLKQFLSDASHEQRKSITKYLNDLVRKEKNKQSQNHKMDEGTKEIIKSGIIKYIEQF